MKGIIEKLSKGDKLSEVDHTIIKVFARFNEGQASLFGQFSILGKTKYKKHGENYLKNLPDRFSYEELEKIARKDAEANTNNNDMGIENQFYKTQVKDYLEKYKGYQKIIISSSRLNTMIYSWFSINLQNRKLMSSLSSSLSIKNGWRIQGSARKCTNTQLEKFVTS